MTDLPLDQLIRINDWLAEHEPDLYYDGDRDTATVVIETLDRLRAVEQAAIEQAEYIQLHGLTDYEVGLLRAEVKRLQAEREFDAVLEPLDSAEIIALRAENDRLREALEVKEQSHD